MIGGVCMIFYRISFLGQQGKFLEKEGVKEVLNVNLLGSWISRLIQKAQILAYLQGAPTKLIFFKYSYY